jgi:hypothetical protein
MDRGPQFGVPAGTFPTLYSQAHHPSRRLNTSRHHGKPYSHSPSSSIHPVAENNRFLLCILPYSVRYTFTHIPSILIKHLQPCSSLELDPCDKPNIRITPQNTYAFFNLLKQNNLEKVIILQTNMVPNIRQQLHSHIRSVLLDNHLVVPGFRELPETLSPLDEAFWEILKAGSMVVQGRLLKSAGLMPYDMANSLDALIRNAKHLRSPISDLPVILICMGVHNHILIFKLLLI